MFFRIMYFCYETLCNSGIFKYFSYICLICCCFVFVFCYFQYRLNRLRWVKSESLEPVSQVTQLDLRDNCLDSLDLNSVCNLETLHCQRNQLEMLTLSGFTLRMLHASSNRESNAALTHCSHCPVFL